MCEARAVKVVDDKEELVMDNVARLVPKGEMLILEGLFGDTVEVKGEIEKIDFVGHKVYIKEREKGS